MAQGTITVVISKTITYDLAKPNFDIETLIEQLEEHGEFGVLGASEIKRAMEEIIRSDCDAEKSEITYADMRVSVSDDAQIEVDDPNEDEDDSEPGDEPEKSR
jgi:uncharacterized protein YjaG (DUF416 family)